MNEQTLREMTELERIDADEAGEEFGGVDRRDFLQVLGAGLVISVTGGVAMAQRGQPGGGGRRPGGFGGGGNISARLHIAEDGKITVMSGKVELGQGARTQLTQAAAEELRLAPERIQMIMADTALTPNDGITAGSRTTPSNVPDLRRAAAAAREMLVDLACKKWQVERNAVAVRDGTIRELNGKRTMTYAELAKAEDLAKTFARTAPAGIELTPVKQWKVMGTPLPRANRRDLVTGAHHYPSDIVRPKMLYGKILRPPSYGATLTEIDLGPAKAMPEVVVVRDGQFVGCCAPSLWLAEKALAALAKTARWKTVSHSSSKDLFARLKKTARRDGGGAAAQALAGAKKVLKADYEIAYIQHCPPEPRAAVAEWADGKITIWTGTSGPFSVWGAVASAVGVGQQQARVIVPDTGCSFGGKHTGEAAVEAARLAKAAGRPVCVRWTREEEFTWAYFRPAGVIEVQGGLDANGGLVAWDFINISSGGAAVDSPYDIPAKRCRTVSADAPLRQSSYRALASTANNFARESFMDELAHAAGRDPLAFRLACLKEPRLRAVLEMAAKKFGWAERKGKTPKGVGVGLACGAEKGSVVATCVEVAVDRKEGKIRVRQVCEVFECGAIQNPANLLSQVQGCIVMGLGGALTEEIHFSEGKIQNAGYGSYHVPRFADVPPIDVHFIERPELTGIGAGETPIIGIAPAIANAVFDATGLRIRRMPLKDRVQSRLA